MSNTNTISINVYYNKNDMNSENKIWVNDPKNHYTIKPGYNIQIDTYIDSVWFIAPTKESYFTDGYLEQSRVIRVWENPLSSRLIDRVLFGNNWSHRLYYIPLLIPERSVFIPNIHRNIYTLKKTHF